MINDSTMSAEIAENRRHTHTYSRKDDDQLSIVSALLASSHCVVNKVFACGFFLHLYALAYLHTAAALISSHPLARHSCAVNSDPRVSRFPFAFNIHSRLVFLSPQLSLSVIVHSSPDVVLYYPTHTRFYTVTTNPQNQTHHSL